MELVRYKSECDAFEIKTLGWGEIYKSKEENIILCSPLSPLGRGNWELVAACRRWSLRRGWWWYQDMPSLPKPQPYSGSQKKVIYTMMTGESLYLFSLGNYTTIRSRLTEIKQGCIWPKARNNATCNIYYDSKASLRSEKRLMLVQKLSRFYLLGPNEF